MITQPLANPDLALILLLVGILLIYIEFNRPGTVLFAAAGMLLLMFALYGLAQHPIRPLALALALAGLTVILLELPIQARNLLALLGTAILAYALHTLENPPIHLTTAVAVSLTFSTVTLWLGRIALQARRNKRLPNPTSHSAAHARRVD